MTSLETQDFARFGRPSRKDDSETGGSRTWRLLVAAATLLAILALGLLDRPAVNGPVQERAPMTGWGKWGGYTP